LKVLLLPLNLNLSTFIAMDLSAANHDARLSRDFDSHILVIIVAHASCRPRRRR
jgi:hypothetical protein